ncbi:MAG: sigma-54-dependent Fis family transcriptional regulator [Planctomycetaceae bacterium]|nr:sigma-54-dependent Fis family transcriptional regulator [Planctomycetaceae bacterium]
MRGTPRTPPILLGQSRAIQELRQKIRQVAPTSESVLIVGENGTGKDLVARALHAASRRQEYPLVRVPCAALDPAAMEAEIFGQGDPATGMPVRVGRIERADRGTLLLDEVTHLPPALQAKLRRVLDERSLDRPGFAGAIPVDLRVLSLLQRSPSEEVAAGRLRQELYYRLAVVPIEIPPLRQRREDIPDLCAHFLQLVAERLHCAPCVFAREALDLLARYDWPGNVRELENLVTRATVLHAGERVTVAAVADWLEVPLAAPGGDAAERLSAVERRHIEATLERFQGHRARTAQALGIGVRTLSAKLKEYGTQPAAGAVPSAHVAF